MSVHPGECQCLTVGKCGETRRTTNQSTGQVKKPPSQKKVLQKVWKVSEKSGQEGKGYERCFSNRYYNNYHRKLFTLCLSGVVLETLLA